MPFGIMLLIPLFIRYNFGGLERVRVNPFQPKTIIAFFGMERVNTFQPKTIVAFFWDGKS
jgi:hypothetical protein